MKVKSITSFGESVVFQMENGDTYSLAEIENMIAETRKPEVKVGDWVEIEDLIGVPAQCKVSEIHEYNVIVVCKSGHNWSLPHKNILRILQPSEVIVKIGCLSGTVERHDGNPIYWFKLRSSEYNYALISTEMLDAPTLELVEDLLNAQEER